jgi:hypothetical protein
MKMDKEEQTVSTKMGKRRESGHIGMTMDKYELTVNTKKVFYMENGYFYIVMELYLTMVDITTEHEMVSCIH